MTAMQAQGQNWAQRLLPPFLFALGLRWIGLRDQVLTDDELHGVHAALNMPVGEIIRNWTFGSADYGVSQAALFRILMDQGVVFSEIDFRIPSLIAGLAAILLIPRLAAHWVGLRAATVLAWLLAISPMLVLYSRIVRPYMPAVLLATCAVLLFYHWWERGSVRSAFGYVLCSVAAVYFHLVAAPLVFGPIACAAAACLLRTERGRSRLGGLFAIASAAAIGLLLILLPAQESLLEIFNEKRDGLPPSLGTFLDVARLQLGTASVIVALLALAVAIRGTMVLWQRQRNFLIYTAVLAGLQVLALVFFAPDRVEERLVFSRYLLVLLPLALLPLAVGLADPWPPRRTDPRRRVELAFAALGIVILFLAGPLFSSRFLSDSFSHSLSSLDFLTPSDRIPYEHVPPFYHQLRDSQRPEVILEYPWQNVSSQAFDAYQDTHGSPVLVASVIDRSDESRLDLRNHVEPNPAHFLDSRATFAVIHLDLRREAGRLETSNIHHRQWLRAESELWGPLRRSGRAMAQRLTNEWGPPAYADESIQVWDLGSLRSTPGGPQ